LLLSAFPIKDYNHKDYYHNLLLYIKYPQLVTANNRQSGAKYQFRGKADLVAGDQGIADTSDLSPVKAQSAPGMVNMAEDTVSHAILLQQLRKSGLFTIFA
jgi:hypothetical protein